MIIIIKIKLNKMKNSEAIGKYIIVKDINFSDYMKDEDDKKLLDTK